MSQNPLYINLIWHMHQPYYKDLQTEQYMMPWVRLHGIKDYYDMAATVKKYPSVKVTFNLVPSLIAQIEDYVSGKANEQFLSLSYKSVDQLTQDEKIAVLKDFFMANIPTMIDVYPAYKSLLEKRGRYITPKIMDDAVEKFTGQDFRDLQVWFNLAWFDPAIRAADPELQRLVEKGVFFKEEEKLYVLEKQKQILSAIVPLYRKLSEDGQIELTTSPFYHPILPLLCNTDIARVAMPNVKLPTRFMHPEDAWTQIDRAVKFHESRFGKPPAGMWPSEGSVSNDMVTLVANAGIKWIASDEAILMRSMRGDRDSLLYQPYRVRVDHTEVVIVFRDSALSDLIGFTYKTWDYKTAVDDFIKRLHEIRQKVAGLTGDHIVSIILDGENAWEYYPNDGNDFLNCLYQRLSNEPLLKTTTLSEYLPAHQPETVIDGLFPGSWINHDFRIWIGHPEDTRAWEVLKKTRDVLSDYQMTHPGEKTAEIAKAWEEIYIAEGSDWCWWYGDEFSSEEDQDFDALYRQQLVNVYKLIDRDPPDELLLPLLLDKLSMATVPPSGLISPIIDGKVSYFYEWSAAGYYEAKQVSGTMQRSVNLCKGIYYGFSLDKLFIRIDNNAGHFSEALAGLIVSLRFLGTRAGKVELAFPDAGNAASSDGKSHPAVITAVSRLFRPSGNDWEEIKSDGIEATAGKILEMAIPFALIEAKPNEELSICISVEKNNEELERYPNRGVISFTVPNQDYEGIMWRV